MKKDTFNQLQLLQLNDQFNRENLSYMFSFYNYIYYTVAGFSEVDTFRSNQIRNGLIGREEALVLSEKENRPRYENISWYLQVIGTPYNYAIKTVNSIPKLY